MTRASGGARIAAIDIGTNTVLLTIAETSGAGGPLSSCYKVLREEARITRVGRGVASSGVIEERAAARTLACLADYAAFLREAGVTELSVVGTSALRDARNGPDFRARASDLLRAEVAIVTGAREAALTFQGTLTALDDLLPKGSELLAFDVGGGSTEFILGTADGEVHAFESLDVGTVRLTEAVFPADFPPDRRPTPELLAALDDAIERALDASVVLPALGHGAARPFVVGIAGTVTTLLALAHAGPGASPPSATHGPLTESTLATLEQRLAGSTLDERLAWPDLDPGRADVILAGSRLVPRIAERIARAAPHPLWHGAPHPTREDPAAPRQGSSEVDIFVSDRGVRHGLLLELAAGLP